MVIDVEEAEEKVRARCPYLFIKVRYLLFI